MGFWVSLGFLWGFKGWFMWINAIFMVLIYIDVCDINNKLFIVAF